MRLRAGADLRRARRRDRAADRGRAGVLSARSGPPGLDPGAPCRGSAPTPRSWGSRRPNTPPPDAVARSCRSQSGIAKAARVLHRWPTERVAADEARRAAGVAIADGTRALERCRPRAPAAPPWGSSGPRARLSSMQISTPRKLVPPPIVPFLFWRDSPTTLVPVGDVHLVG